MIDNQQLVEMQSIPLESSDFNALIEIESVTINRQLSKEPRILQFIEEIKNPYCFKVGDSIVKTQFASSGISLQDALGKSFNR